MPSLPNRSWPLCSLILFFDLLIPGQSAAEAPRMVQFQIASQNRNGLLLIDVPQRTVILGRDGWLHDTIDHAYPRIVGNVDTPFRAVTAAEVRGDLQAEFGNDFEVVTTTHYLVVQPRGRGDRWPQLFESLYREFVGYIEVRGLSARAGRFPLVAVVMPDEAAMQAELTKLNVSLSRFAGVYHLASNRVVMHDQGNAAYVAETVRHETAHQAAYNVGVHSRVSETPRWIVEGIGSLFEPAAMQDRRLQRSVRDRVHHGYVKQFVQTYSDRQRLFTEMQSLVNDDSAFSDPQRIADAYCLSWAMTFYLAERSPDSFAAMVTRTGKQPPFRVYSPAQRRQDFESATSLSTAEFAALLSQYISSLQ